MSAGHNLSPLEAIKVRRPAPAVPAGRCWPVRRSPHATALWPANLNWSGHQQTTTQRPRATGHGGAPTRSNNPA